MDSNEFEEIRFLGPGFNWGKIQGTIAVGVGGGDSPLPAGTRVSAETYDPGKACMQCPKSVAEGRLDMAITTPVWYAAMAFLDKGYFPSPLPPFVPSLALPTSKSLPLHRGAVEHYREKGDLQPSKGFRAVGSQSL